MEWDWMGLTDIEWDWIRLIWDWLRLIEIERDWMRLKEIDCGWLRRLENDCDWLKLKRWQSNIACGWNWLWLFLIALFSFHIIFHVIFPLLILFSLSSLFKVLMHDPLYMWTLSPVQALRKQQRRGVLSNMSLDNDEEKEEQKSANRDATLAIQKIQQKLGGVEYGEYLAVEGQIKLLINESRDPSRLSKLFVGWSPWVWRKREERK